MSNIVIIEAIVGALVTSTRGTVGTINANVGASVASLTSSSSVEATAMRAKSSA